MQTPTMKYTPTAVLLARKGPCVTILRLIEAEYDRRLETGTPPYRQVMADLNAMAVKARRVVDCVEGKIAGRLGEMGTRRREMWERTLKRGRP